MLFNITVSQEELEACRAAQRDMLEALKARKAALEDALKQRTDQLKALCLKEAVSDGYDSVHDHTKEYPRTVNTQTLYIFGGS